MSNRPAPQKNQSGENRPPISTRVDRRRRDGSPPADKFDKQCQWTWFFCLFLGRAGTGGRMDMVTAIGDRLGSANSAQNSPLSGWSSWRSYSSDPSGLWRCRRRMVGAIRGQIYPACPSAPEPLTSCTLFRRMPPCLPCWSPVAETPSPDSRV